MVISSPCLMTSPEQTATGKDFSNPWIVDSLLKTIWSSMHHVFTMKHWLLQSKRLLKPDVYVSFIKQFWRSAEVTTADNGEVKIIATIDEHHFPIPHDSPLHDVHSYGSDEGSLKLNELVNLVTKLSDKIGVLKADLKKTKKTYSSAYTKIILRVKKLESQIKIRKAKRQAKVVLSDDEDIADDSSKQGRKLSNVEVQDKASNETEPVSQDVNPTEVIQDQESSEKGSVEVSTVGAKQGTASEKVPIVSIAEVNLSTARGTVTYTRRSAEKNSRQDKGKAIMIESEPKKKSKKELEQERLSFAEAIRLEEQMDEEQRAQIIRDEEIARHWDEEELWLKLSLLRR
ncbi:hypothetical protein Tco_0877665 [Tanacetum coccineum]|uniref:Uncharacterized protein n=1 Tax=Tanacetum coccineum TaxID=301880 RepID=A0ABQ5C0Z4_9ASTR